MGVCAAKKYFLIFGFVLPSEFYLHSAHTQVAQAVTKPARGGIRPSAIESINGFIYLNGELQDTSTEQKFLACFGLGYICPEKRRWLAETDTHGYKELISATKLPNPLSQVFQNVCALFRKESAQAEPT